MKKISVLRSYTLVETMFVIFFLIVISAFAFRYYYRFKYSYRSSVDNAIRMRQIMSISERWRQALGGTSEQIPVAENGKIVFAGNDYAAVEKKQITICRSGKNYSLRLPKNTNAALTVEKNQSGSYLAVLNLSWKYSHSPNAKAPGKTHSVRIISALKVKHGDQS
jgi:Tfp pilus assembly protein PilE